MIEMKYLVVVEKGEKGFGAYVPDLPGCVAAADTRDEVLQLIGKRLSFTLKVLRNQAIPYQSRYHEVNSSKYMPRS